MVVNSLIQDKNWISTFFNKRSPLFIPSDKRSITHWQDTLLNFHKQRHIVWRDGNITLQRILQNAYTLWRHFLVFANQFIEDTEDLLSKYGGENVSRLQILIGLSLSGLFFLITLLFIIRSRQTRATIKAHNLRVFDKDKEYFDEYDFEDDFDEDEDEEDRRAMGLPPHIRRILNGSRNRNNRSGSKDSVSSRIRQSNHIRIISSDPQSQLSGNAIEMDLNNLHLRPGHSPVPHSRKRKESGRLLPSSSTSNESSSGSASSAPSSPRLVHTAGRIAKQRRTTSGRNTVAADHEHKRPGRLDTLSLRTGRSSLSNDSEDGSSITHSPTSITSFSSAKMELDGSWITSSYPDGITNKLISILKREPQAYASLPQTPLRETVQDSIPQESQRPIDSSWHVSEFANSDVLHHLPPAGNLIQSTGGRLPPGAGRGGSSSLTTLRNASSPRLGFLTPEQTQALWPEKRQRKVKLREPDWRPYISIHERARERLERFAEVGSNNGNRSGSPLLISGSSVSTEEGSGGSGNGSNTGDEEDEFWFERFTRSTAASGRDWDWRKRRLRQQANSRLTTIGGGNSIEGGVVGTDGNPVQNMNGIANQFDVNKPLPFQPSEMANIQTSENDPRILKNRGVSVPNRTVSAPLFPSNGGAVPADNSNQNENGINKSILSAFEQGKKIAANGGQHWPRYQSSARTVSLGSTERSLIPQTTDSLPPFPKRNRRFSDTDQRDTEEAVNVPGRFSSLKPKEVKKMILRGINTSSKTDLRGAALEEERSREEYKQDSPVHANGWTIEPHSGLGLLNSNFAASTPELNFNSTSHERANGLSSWTHESIDDGQHAWSSADAYGSSSSPSNNSSSRNGFGGGGENVLTDDLAKLYGKVYTSTILSSPQMNHTFEEQQNLDSGPQRKRPIRHETMPLLHSSFNEPERQGV